MQRPEHIAKIGECLTLWPDVDLNLALLLASLTRANADAMVAVYATLRRSTARFEAIQAAARVSFDLTGQTLIAAVLKFAETVEGSRNDLAHGQWGISLLVPDAILWVSGAHSIDIHVKTRRSGIERRRIENDLTASRIFYYTLSDFGSIRQDINNLCDALWMVRSFLDNHHWAEDGVSNASAQLCAHIESFSAIRQALSQIDGYVLQPIPPTPPRRRNATLPR
jgi:hypothetical protein